MYDVGDKFIIEIDSVMTNKKGALYGIKCFNSLVFDEKGLDRLTNYEDGFIAAFSDAMNKGYEKGLSDAWEAAKKIYNDRKNGGLSISELVDIYGTSVFDDIAQKFTPQEAIEKLKKWEEKQKIKEGDYIISNNGTMAVVQRVDSWGRWECLTKNGQTLIKDDKKQYWKKTGKHIDLTEIFKELEVEG